KTPINVVVPSFPRQQPGVVHFDSKETADIVLHALENRGVFTKRSIEKGGNRRALKNAVRS
ncbi:MAG TPA: hypothetical protein VN743_00055, partial [Blastocatellia bacterium]|nr:hypothetical protein [Blastocatellia bacterium]